MHKGQTSYPEGRKPRNSCKSPELADSIPPKNENHPDCHAGNTFIDTSFDKGEKGDLYFLLQEQRGLQTSITRDRFSRIILALKI